MEAEAGDIPRTAAAEVVGVRNPKDVRSGGGGAEEARPSDGHHESDDRCRPSAHWQNPEQQLPCRRMRLRP